MAKYEVFKYVCRTGEVYVGLHVTGRKISKYDFAYNNRFSRLIFKQDWDDSNIAILCFTDDLEFAHEVYRNTIARELKMKHVLLNKLRGNREILEWDKDGNLIRVFECVKQVCDELHTESNHQYVLCRYNKTDSRGHAWCYLNHWDGKPIFAVNTRHSRKVVQLDKEGKEIARYDSIKEASKASRVFGSNIVTCCQNRHKMAGGYVWQYVED